MYSFRLPLLLDGEQINRVRKLSYLSPVIDVRLIWRPAFVEAISAVG